MYTPPGSVDAQNGDGDIIDGDWQKTADHELCIIQNITIRGSNYTRNAAAVRDCLCEYVNGPGQVPWQWKILLP